MARRVVESFPLYDTVMISDAIDDLNYNDVGWYETYASLGGQNKISFFDQRKQTDVDLAYCNLDAKERFPYGYKAYSFGIVFQGPALGTTTYTIDGETGAIVPGESNWTMGHIFSFELPKHCGVRVRLDQSDVLESNVMFSPAGVAAHGQSNLASSSDDAVGVTCIENVSNTGAFGQPMLTNRFRFPVPLIIPDNSVFSVELEFSRYGKALLAQMLGPDEFLFPDADETTLLAKKYFSSSIIQVSLIGARYIQQRGELSAQVPNV